MGGHLGTQKGAWAGPLKIPNWSPHLNLGTPPEKPKPLDCKGEVNRKEGLIWKGFPLALFCPPFLILREREPWVPVTKKGYTQSLPDFQVSYH
jgi:hypothetical protein